MHPRMPPGHYIRVYKGKADVPGSIHALVLHDDNCRAALESTGKATHSVLQVHVEREQMLCHLTRTTRETHRLIQENLEETPVYGGWVDSNGPRYCPSIEDKIVRFKDKESHQVAA